MGPGSETIVSRGARGAAGGRKAAALAATQRMCTEVLGEGPVQHLCDRFAILSFELHGARLRSVACRSAVLWACKQGQPCLQWVLAYSAPQSPMCPIMALQNYIGLDYCGATYAFGAMYLFCASLAAMPLLSQRFATSAVRREKILMHVIKSKALILYYTMLKTESSLPPGIDWIDSR